MQVINGAVIWRAKATSGFPLDMALQILAQHKLVPAWDYLFEAARRDGTNTERLTREICFYVKEAYPKKCADKIIQKLQAGKQFCGIYGNPSSPLYPAA